MVTSAAECCFTPACSCSCSWLTTAHSHQGTWWPGSYAIDVDLKTPERRAWNQRWPFTELDHVGQLQRQAPAIKVCADLVKGAKKESGVKRSVRKPTQTPPITTRKTPCGKVKTGISATWQSTSRSVTYSVLLRLETRPLHQRWASRSGSHHCRCLSQPLINWLPVFKINK